MGENTLTIELDPPIEWNGKAYAALELREPTLGDMDVASKQSGNFAVTAMLISKVAKVPLQVALQVPISVATRAGMFFEGFMPPSPTTGET